MFWVLGTLVTCFRFIPSAFPGGVCLLFLSAKLAHISMFCHLKTPPPRLCLLLGSSPAGSKAPATADAGHIPGSQAILGMCSFSPQALGSHVGGRECLGWLSAKAHPACPAQAQACCSVAPFPADSNALSPSLVLVWAPHHYHSQKKTVPGDSLGKCSWFLRAPGPACL